MTQSAQPPDSLSPSISKNKPEKAAAILTGALEVFSEQGYAAASMERIAKAAKVSKPTLYKYFQDKEGLFSALVQQLTERNRQRLPLLLAKSVDSLPPQEVLRQIATMVIDDFPRDEAILKLMRLIIGESERFPHIARTFVREIEKPMIEKFAAYFARQPQLQLSDPMVTARVFIGSVVHYLIIQQVLHGSEILPLERDRMVDGLISLITAQDSTKVGQT